MLKILAIISGEYGRRHVENIQKHGPQSWQVEVWQAPAILPPVVDYPEDYIPAEMPPAELILSFAEHKGVAELLPDIAALCRAKAVIVAVDNEAWLPRGLARQLKGWLSAIDIACATPKPLCTLTDKDYKITRRQRESYDSPEIAEFARYFGQPDLQITVDPESRTIASARVRRDAACGCIRHVAERLVGVHVDEAEEKAGLLHHHFPCLASMVKLDDYNHDTLMHESGNMLKDNINAQIKPFKDPKYISPNNRSE
jgi:thymidylate synthase